jgi:hypothetical protein
MDVFPFLMLLNLKANYVQQFSVTKPSFPYSDLMSEDRKINPRPWKREARLGA